MSEQAADMEFGATEGQVRLLPTTPRLHVGQFVLGPRVPAGLLGWRQLALAERLHVLAHPALNLTRVGDDVASIALIGFILDPNHPAADDRQILARLLDHFTSIDALVAATSNLGGRWTMVAIRDGRRYLFSDALGLRQAFYTRAHDGVWAISQCGLALELDLFPVTPDDAVAGFLDSFEFRSHREYRWPAAASPFKQLKRLLPNHVLDLADGNVRRYWPDGALDRLEPDAAVAVLVPLLRGMVAAAHRRFEFVLALTAGIDSRLVLAACRELRDRIGYVTVRQSGMEDHNMDLVVPARLLAGVGLTQDVIRARASMSPIFSWTFKRNVLMAHDHYGADAEAILLRFGRRKVVMTGSGAEIGRCSFRTHAPFAEARGLTAADLARLQGMGANEFALRHFGAWLNGLGRTWNVKHLDLFEWEQGHGSWLACTQLEFDIAWREIVTPYNCRTLLTTLLAVDEKYRRAPHYQLFRMLIEALWPDLLSEPINPGQRPSSLRRFAAGIGRRFNQFIPWVGVMPWS